MARDGASIKAVKLEGRSALVRGVRFRSRGNMVKRNIGPWRMPMEQYGEEGRGKLRKAAERSTHPLTRRFPNGVTQGKRFPYRAHE